MHGTSPLRALCSTPRAHVHRRVVTSAVSKGFIDPCAKAVNCYTQLTVNCTQWHASWWPRFGAVLLVKYSNRPSHEMSKVKWPCNMAVWDFAVIFDSSFSHCRLQLLPPTSHPTPSNINRSHFASVVPRCVKARRSWIVPKLCHGTRVWRRHLSSEPALRLCSSPQAVLARTT